jgi:magnesium-transporting ATPase (P-type)
MMDKGMISFILISGFLAFLAGSFVFLFSIWELSGGLIPGINTTLLTSSEWATGFAPNGTHWEEILKHARTNVFASVVAFELMFVWNCRDEYNPVWKTSIRESKTLIGAVLLSLVLTMATIYVPFMQPLFETVPLDIIDWAIVLVSCLPALLIPPHKIFGRFRDKPEN